MTRCATNSLEFATIEALLREDAKNLIDRDWWTDLKSTLSEPAEERDSHWKWRELVSIHQSEPFFRASCVRTADGAIQAAVLYRVDALSAIERGERAVFVDRLASAPRNRDWLIANPVFRGAGSGLLAHVVAVSYSLGFGGRVNLFSMDNDAFYRGLGFVPTGVAQDEMTILELPASLARVFLRRKGWLDD